MSPDSSVHPGEGASPVGGRPRVGAVRRAAWQARDVSTDPHDTTPSVPSMPPAPPLPHQGRIDSTDGVELAVYDFGGSGQDALLAHANGFCAGVIAPLARELHPWHCVAFDSRAHGRSGSPEGSMAWEGHRDDVLAVLDGTGLERPIGIGHSMGGAALLLAEQHRPGTFAALWLFEPVVFPPMAELHRESTPWPEGGAATRALRQQGGGLRQLRGQGAARRAQPRVPCGVRGARLRAHRGPRRCAACSPAEEAEATEWAPGTARGTTSARSGARSWWPGGGDRARPASWHRWSPTSSPTGASRSTPSWDTSDPGRSGGHGPQRARPSRARLTAARPWVRGRVSQRGPTMLHDPSAPHVAVPSKVSTFKDCALAFPLLGDRQAARVAVGSGDEGHERCTGPRAAASAAEAAAHP